MWLNGKAKKKKKLLLCSNPTSGYIQRKWKLNYKKDICTPMFTAALFTIAKIRKQPNYLLTNESIKKMCETVIYIVIFFLLKKKEILPFATTQQHRINWRVRKTWSFSSCCFHPCERSAMSLLHLLILPWKEEWCHMTGEFARRSCVLYFSLPFFLEVNTAPPGWEGKALLVRLPITEWPNLSNSEVEY